MTATLAQGGWMMLASSVALTDHAFSTANIDTALEYEMTVGNIHGHRGING